MSWGSFWHSVKHTVKHVVHDVTHVWHDAYGWTKEEADQYTNDIENAMKGYLRDDAYSLIKRIETNSLGQDFLKIVSEQDKLLKWSADNLKKNYWDADPLQVELIGANSISDNKAPIITIKPHFSISNVDFIEKLNVNPGDPRFDYGNLSFSDHQSLNIDLGSNLGFKVGVDLEIQTFDEGQYSLPISLSEKLAGGKKKLAEDQESDGIFSYAASLGLKGGIQVNSAAENKVFNFSVDQPLSVNVNEDLFVKFGESIDVGSIGEAAAKFLSNPLHSGSEERDLIDKNNHFSATANITGDSPHRWLDLGQVKVNHPDDLTGLDGFFTISPQISLKLGMILKELGEGVNIASINADFAASNEFTFGESNDVYDFSLIADAGITGLGLSIGPANWSAFSQSLAKETWNLADVNLLNGQTSSNWEHPQFSSGVDV